MAPDTSPSGNPLVSILIPCFNAEQWVAQCIQSALDQTYEPKEIIVVDDGSTDGTMRIIESFRAQIRFERLGHNGANVVRNRLLELSRGTWLQYLDADDYLLPDKVARQMETAVQGSEADVIYSPVRIRYEQRGTEETTTIAPDADPELNFIRWCAFSTISVLFNRQALMDIQGWKPDQPCCQEHEVIYRLITSGKRFRYSEYAGSVYRIHGSDTISHRDPALVIRTRMSLTDQMDAYLRESGRKSHHHRVALYIARMEAARSLYSFDQRLARHYYRKAIQEGRPFVWSSPALPFTYQVASLLSSLDGAETIAAWWRKVRGTPSEA